VNLRDGNVHLSLLLSVSLGVSRLPGDLLEGVARSAPCSTIRDQERAFPPHVVPLLFLGDPRVDGEPLRSLSTEERPGVGRSSFLSVF
jgi:hypothetical protein